MPNGQDSAVDPPPGTYLGTLNGISCVLVCGCNVHSKVGNEVGKRQLTVDSCRGIRKLANRLVTTHNVH